MGRGIRANRTTRALVLLGVATLGIVLALLMQSHPSRADVYPAGQWNCRSSVARVADPLPQALNNIEPFVANGNTNTPDPVHDILKNTGPMDSPFCANTNNALPSFNQSGLNIQLPFAQTKITPQGGDTINQQVDAITQAADVTLSGAGTIALEVNGAHSEAHAHCAAGQPVFTGSSQLVKVILGGNAIPLNQLIQQIATAITGSGLNVLAKIYVDRQLALVDANNHQYGLIQRALEVDLLDVMNNNNPVLQIVVGEAKVTQAGLTCTAAPPPPTNTVVTTNTVTTAGPTQTQTVAGPTQTVAGPTQTQVVTVPAPSSGVLGNTNTQPNGTNGGCGHLRMHFRNNGKTAISDTFGQRQVTRGTIISCSGSPIVHAKIDVYHFINGKRVKLVKTGLRSRGGGKLTLILPLNLTTRTIEFDYRPFLDNSRVGSRVKLHITVRSSHTGKILRGPAPGANA